MKVRKVTCEEARDSESGTVLVEVYTDIFGITSPPQFILIAEYSSPFVVSPGRPAGDKAKFIWMHGYPQYTYYIVEDEKFIRIINEAYDAYTKL